MLVEVKDLTKRFGKLTAVDGVHFSIPSGEAFGLLGPNGAGKTTTVSMMCGLAVPSAGDVVIDGHSVLRDPMAVRRVIGVVPQDIALYPTLSARENLTFFARMQDVPSRHACLPCRRRPRHRPAGRPPEGPGRDVFGRHEAARQHRSRPAQPAQLLILDEPTVGVDPQSRNSILETLKELNRQGMTLLYTSHYMEEVEFLCTHIAIMDHGKVIADGTQQDLRLQAGNKDIINVQLVREADNAVRDRLAALPGVDTVELRDKVVRIATNQGRSLLAGVISALDNAGCPVSTIDVKEPNLEDLFLNLTGTSLRD